MSTFLIIVTYWFIILWFMNIRFEMFKYISLEFIENMFKCKCNLTLILILLPFISSYMHPYWFQLFSFELNHLSLWLRRKTTQFYRMHFLKDAYHDKILSTTHSQCWHHSIIQIIPVILLFLKSLLLLWKNIYNLFNSWTIKKKITS